MNTEILLMSGELRPRQKDNERVKSIIKSSETNSKVALGIKLTDESATLIFREIYESIRQLGDAKWWILGYEPLNHEVSMEILKEFDIKEKIRLNHLSRFKKIRNDANYRGFMITISQTEEIIEFWNKCAKDIIQQIKKSVSS